MNRCFRCGKFIGQNTYKYNNVIHDINLLFKDLAVFGSMVYHNNCNVAQYNEEYRYFWEMYHPDLTDLNISKFKIN